MMYSGQTDELGFGFSDLKRITSNAAKKVTRPAKKALTKVTKGMKNAVCSSAAKTAGGAATAVPHPAAQATGAVMSAMQSLCPAPKATAEDPATIAAQETALQALVPQPEAEPFYKNPLVIGGGAAGVLLIAFLALRK